MESTNFLELAVAFYKDMVQKELLEEFRKESILLLQADADARRTIAREKIIAMGRLKIELNKFKFIYNRLSSTCGTFSAIDDYIRDIELKVKKLSYEKNSSIQS